MPPRVATGEDAADAATLLDAFNTEFATPTPGVAFLTDRIAELIDGGDADFLLGGEGPDAVLVLRLRPALWDSGEDANIEELYVRPELRGKGIGEELLRFAIDRARTAGAVRVELGTDEGDEAAHGLYEKLGFTNFTGADDRERMFFYEREL